MSKRREWWFNLTMRGEYSTPLNEGKHDAFPEHDYVHVIEFNPSVDAVLSREMIDQLISRLQFNFENADVIRELREVLK